MYLHLIECQMLIKAQRPEVRSACAEKQRAGQFADGGGSVPGRVCRAAPLCPGSSCPDSAHACHGQCQAAHRSWPPGLCERDPRVHLPVPGLPQPQGQCNIAATRTAPPSSPKTLLRVSLSRHRSYEYQVAMHPVGVSVSFLWLSKQPACPTTFMQPCGCTTVFVV